MARFRRIMCLVSLSSVYLMQAPCTTNGDGSGLSIIPNIGGTFSLGGFGLML